MRVVEVHIEELVLEGVRPASSDAFAERLTERLAATFEAEESPAARSDDLIDEAARTIHGSIMRATRGGVRAPSDAASTARAD